MTPDQKGGGPVTGPAGKDREGGRASPCVLIGGRSSADNFRASSLESRQDGLESVSMRLRGKESRRTHLDLNQGPDDLRSAALTTELCTQLTNISFP